MSVDLKKSDGERTDSGTSKVMRNGEHDEMRAKSSEHRPLTKLWRITMFSVNNSRVSSHLTTIYSSSDS